MTEKVLVLFIHGLGGSAASTWGNFPELIQQDAELTQSFDVATFEYETGVVSSSVPSTEAVARLLGAYIQREHSDRNNITIVAHSLGGLVARRHICNVLQEGTISPLKIGRLLTFATPHLGAGAAYAVRKVASAQVRDVAVDSDFLMRLGEDWQRLAAHEQVWVKYVIAGQDALVSQTSAHGANWNDGYEVIPGIGHIALVKPESPAALSFTITKRFLRSKSNTFIRYVKPNYTQPLLLRRVVANKERNRFFFGAEAIEFMGRDTELVTLREFLDPVRSVFQWMLIHGSGGVGKSRLAHEFCKQIDGEWYAGFVSLRDMARDWRTWQPIMPTLIIVDYAAQASYLGSGSNALTQMIGDLADRAAGQPATTGRAGFLDHA